MFLIGPTFQISWLELLTPRCRRLHRAAGAAADLRRRLGAPRHRPGRIRARLSAHGFRRRHRSYVKSLIYFDAALVNSHVMQVFKITGGIALRLAYGDNGYFLFSVGGFHPSFNPGGLELPRLARAGACTSVAIAWFKLENYFALTSNTFQVGAAVEAGIELGPICGAWLVPLRRASSSSIRSTSPRCIDAGFDVEVFGESLLRRACDRAR